MQTERPLSDREIKILKQIKKRLDKRKSFQIRFLIGWTLLAITIGLFAYLRLETTNERYLLIGTIVIYMLIGLWIFMEFFLKHKNECKNIDFVYNNNKVKSIKVAAAEYIELSEVEDEGVNYLFQITDNKILSLGGQDFYPTRNFPSDNFEIAICYGQNGQILLLEKYNSGKKIYPKKKIVGQKKWDLISHPNYPNPENFTIIEGKLENIERIIDDKKNNST